MRDSLKMLKEYVIYKKHCQVCQRLRRFECLLIFIFIQKVEWNE